MTAYSVDLRTRVLAALDRGMSRDEAASTFQVSLATQKRWLTRRRQTGDLAPHPATGGRNRTIPPAREAELRSQVLATPDATIAEHTARWNTTHTTRISQSTMGRAIRRLGLPRKKSR